MFTHTSRDDADAVYRTVFKRQDRSIAARVVPHAVFVDPEVASVGLTAQAAREAGHTVAAGRQEFTGVAKAKAIGQTRGFVEFVTDAHTDRLLGCHIVGPERATSFTRRSSPWSPTPPTATSAAPSTSTRPSPKASTPPPAASTAPQLLTLITLRCKAARDSRLSGDSDQHCINAIAGRRVAPYEASRPLPRTRMAHAIHAQVKGGAAS
jgi:hypothetical protein